MSQLKTVHLISHRTSMPTIDIRTVTVKNEFEGDRTYNDQGYFKVTVNSTGKAIHSTQIFKENKLYIQKNFNKWYVTDSSAPMAQIIIDDLKQDFDAASNLALIKNAPLTDHGEEKIAGVSLRHISVALNKDAFNERYKALFSSPDHAVKIDKPTEDLWIDDATSYVHRIILKYTMITDTSTLAKPITLSDYEETTTDYSNFNQPVTITSPTNAIPTSNILDAK